MTGQPVLSFSFTEKKTVEMEIEAKVILLVMMDIIPIDLMVDVVVSMTPKGMVIVMFLTILMEVVKIDPLLLSLEDYVDMVDTLNSMNNLKGV